jgi:hypothetical protein
MITPLVILFLTVSITSFLLVGKPDQEEAYAQTQGTNFTQLFSTNKEFQICPEDISMVNLTECTPLIDVLYQDSTLLVLTSDYIDIIWEAVARAQKEGYQIDALTTYTGGSTTTTSGSLNLLVAMSK